MCGRLILDYGDVDEDEFSVWLEEPPAQSEASWNLRPTQHIPIVVTDGKSGERRFETAFWSL